MRRRRTPIVAALTALALAAACGDDDGAATAEVRRVAADDALATRLLVRRSDLPGRWDQRAAADEARQDSLACADGGGVTITGETDSRQFEGGPTVILSDATVFATEEQARTAFDRATDEAFAECVADRLTSEAGADADLTFGDPRVAEVDAGDAGDESGAFRVEFTVLSRDVDLDAFMHVHLVREGRGVAVLGFVSFGRPFAGAAAEQLARAVAERARAGGPAASLS